MSTAYAEPTWVVTVAVPRPLTQFYSYQVTAEQASALDVGGWVLVPFGRGSTHAFVVEKPCLKTESQIDPDLTLKSVLEVGPADQRIPRDVYELCLWASDYYCAPLGEVLGAAVSTASLGLRSAKRDARKLNEYQSTAETKSVAFTDEQLAAISVLKELQKKPGEVALLHGVTGSGKTEVYLEIARQTLALGKGVLVLVPEIALTPQLHERFERGLGCRVGSWHSAMSDGQRRDQFHALLSGELNVVVGARSAVFAPVSNLGLVIVDEEHDQTYKQEDRVRYQARDLAIVRGKKTGSLVILGSATPSLETRERVLEGKYTEAKMTRRPQGGSLPCIDVVSLSEELLCPDTRSVLAERSLEEIRSTLERGEQVIVFLNKRGFASVLICKECGEVKVCPHCSISLTLHQRPPKLLCHLCAHQERIPETCQKCGGYELEGLGAGTESLEDELSAALPEAKISRLDRDQVTSNRRLTQILDDFRSGKSNLLLGTQMLVKGHDFPQVTLVVVMLADALFRWPDFRSPERAYQVLRQVSGRAGRGTVPGKVLIQTYQPMHPVLQVVRGEMSEEDFYSSEREIRQMIGYPPFARLGRLRFEDPEGITAKKRAEEAVRILKAGNFADLEILGPNEALLERFKGSYRWDVLLRARRLVSLHPALRMVMNRIPAVVDVDPSTIG